MKKESRKGKVASVFDQAWQGMGNLSLCMKPAAVTGMQYCLV
jgi:hypothetical protein